MAKPTRTFSAAPGQQSTGTRGPLQIMYDFDQIFAMFDPASYLPDGSPGGIREENIYTVESVSALPPNPSAGNRLVFVKDPDGDGSNKGTWYYYDGSNWRATSASVIDHMAQLNRRALDLRDFGAIPDSTTDITNAFVRAIDEIGEDGGTIFVPAGTYMLFNTITIPQGVNVIGAGRRATRIIVPSNFSDLPVLRFGDNGAPVRDTLIAHLSIDNPDGGANVTGLAVYQGRDCKVLHCGFYRLEKGIQVYGGDTWSSGVTIIEPNIFGCMKGIELDADPGKECNATLILGGIIVGNETPQPGTIGIDIQKGNTNLVVGTDVEGCEVGILIASTDALGNRIVMARTEGNTTGIELGPGTKNNMIVGAMANDIVDNSGELTNFILADGQIFMGSRPIKFGEMALARGAANRLDLGSGDLKFQDGRGPILVDKVTTTWYRLEVENGSLVLTPL